MIGDNVSAISVRELPTITLGKAEERSAFTQSEMKVLTRTGVPETGIKKVEDFINIVENTKFLRANAEPKEEWDVSFGTDWDDARRVVRTKVRDVRICFRQNTKWHVDLRHNSKLGSADHVVRSMARTAGRNDALDVVRDGVKRSVQKTLRDSMRNDVRNNRISRDTKYHIEQCAVQDAVMRAYFSLISDIPLNDKKKRDRYDELAQHADERWEVWRKRFALFCGLTWLENDSLSKEKKELDNGIKKIEKLYVYGVKIFKKKQQKSNLHEGHKPELSGVAR